MTFFGFGEKLAHATQRLVFGEGTGDSIQVRAVYLVDKVEAVAG